ncbi:MAG: DUF4012 domain-containing protein [Patescibacteria group bacterium]|nr:DUF4012 domain-containing protein [Patescibacteria group bacterium]MDD4610834.1 DUF4012 domain-containing protein [Patescibacteria group bacterium]
MTPIFSRKKRINISGIEEKIEKFAANIPLVKERRRRNKIANFLKYFSLGIIISLAVFVIVVSVLFFSFRDIYYQAIEGKNNLETALAFAQSGNFNQSQIFSQNAEKNFNNVYSNIREIKNNFIIARFSALEYQFNDLEYLANAGTTLSRALDQSSLFGQKFTNLLSQNKNLNFAQFSEEEKKNILKLVFESTPELNGLKANLELAALNLNQVKAYGFLWPLKNKIDNVKVQLNEAKKTFNEIIPMAEMLPYLAGYPNESNFLVLLQNSDELRPTGGFLGTYGNLTIKNGDILNFSTHDVYHLDMPVENRLNIVPPPPIKKYLNDQWFMRDANWSPDWPESAKNIEWFYQMEYNYLPAKEKIDKFDGNFSGVIGITPKLVSDLLSLTGPIIIEGEEYNKDNFTKLLEYRVEKSYVKLGIPSWQRKEVIGEIFKEIKIKLFNLPIAEWPKLIDIVSRNLYERNILFYFNDSQIQNLSKNLGWAGEVKETAGDYLMAVDANMGAFKTDAVMSKSIKYSLEEKNGEIIATAKINYAHHGGFDWRTTRYQSYTRLYVPLGSELIRAEGISDGEAAVGQELNKTYFGGYIKIEPGDIGSLIFTYKLPDKISAQIKSGIYGLYIQKQPGSNIEKLTVDFKFNNKIKSYSPVGFSVSKEKNNEIGWESDLSVDKRFEVDF